MATPIFIVGWRRSGTTLLGNLLSRHPRVAAVLYTSGRGHGVFESVYFSHLAGKYGDLRDPSNFIRFVEIYANGSYFELSGVDKETLYGLYPADYPQIFRATMEAMASKQGADHWLEKSPPHVFHLEELLACYPDALFLATRRDMIEQLGSALKMLEAMRVSDKALSRLARAARLLKELLSFHGAESHLRRFARRHPGKILLVPFRDLLADRRRTLAEVCDFAGLDFQEEMLDTRLPANTAFSHPEQRKQALSKAERSLCAWLGPLLGVMPYWFYRMSYKIQRARLGHRLPLAFFALREQKYGWVSLYDENGGKY